MTQSCRCKTESVDRTLALADWKSLSDTAPLAGHVLELLEYWSLKWCLPARRPLTLRPVSSLLSPPVPPTSSHSIFSCLAGAPYFNECKKISYCDQTAGVNFGLL